MRIAVALAVCTREETRKEEQRQRNCFQLVPDEIKHETQLECLHVCNTFNEALWPVFVTKVKDVKDKC